MKNTFVYIHNNKSWGEREKKGIKMKWNVLSLLLFVVVVARKEIENMVWLFPFFFFLKREKDEKKEKEKWHMKSGFLRMKYIWI